jgi:hypothetical protein
MKLVKNKLANSDTIVTDDGIQLGMIYYGMQPVDDDGAKPPEVFRKWFEEAEGLMTLALASKPVAEPGDTEKYLGQIGKLILEISDEDLLKLAEASGVDVDALHRKVMAMIAKHEPRTHAAETPAPSIAAGIADAFEHADEIGEGDVWADDCCVATIGSVDDPTGEFAPKHLDPIEDVLVNSGMTGHLPSGKYVTPESKEEP